MQHVIRDALPSDLEEVLALNQAFVPALGSVGIDEMVWFLEHANYFRLCRIDNRLAAFLIGLRPGTAYMSPNYRWFCERYGDFCYVDRVAVDEFAQRRGLAKELYEDFSTMFRDEVSLMTCEVNLKPPNKSSMQFHLGLGFEQVGTQATESGRKEVAMLIKDIVPDD